MNEVTKKENLTPEAIKDINKRRWINQIYLKRAQQVPLSSEDWTFLINMQLSEGNEEYAKLIKADAEIVQKAIEDMKDELSPEDYIKALQGQIHLKSALYRNVKQGQRDDAITRKMDVDTLNKYSKMVRERGLDPNSDIVVKIQEAIREREFKIVDVKKDEPDT
jgi:hypothetical protein